jgi:hypothetical protein
MKLRKTRIQKITKANGVEVFSPQIKTLFGLDWCAFTEYVDTPLPMSFNQVLINEHNLEYKDLCKSLEEAKKVIDEYVGYVNHQNASQIENKVTKTEYIDYP